MNDVEIALWVANFMTLGIFGLALSGVLRRQQILDNGAGGASMRQRLGPRVGQNIDALQRLIPDRAGQHEFVFLSATCGSCLEVALAIGRRVEAEPAYADRVTVLFQAEQIYSLSSSIRVLSDQSEVFAKAGVSVVPYAVTVEAGRVIASSPVTPAETWNPHPSPSSSSTHKAGRG